MAEVLSGKFLLRFANRNVKSPCGSMRLTLGSALNESCALRFSFEAAAPCETLLLNSFVKSRLQEL